MKNLEAFHHERYGKMYLVSENNGFYRFTWGDGVFLTVSRERFVNEFFSMEDLKA